MQRRSRFRFWQRWLVVVSGATVLFGLLMALGSGTWLFESYLGHVDEAFWPAGRPAGADALYRWIFAVLGSSIAGWGVALTWIAHGPFGRRERWAQRCFLLSLGTWVFIDSGFSWHFGVHQEVLFNAAAVLLVGVPLVATRRAFRRRSGEDDDLPA